MNIDDLYEDIRELQDENADQNLIDSLEELILITDLSFDNRISEKDFNKHCDNFKKDFPDYPFPNCIYYRGSTGEN